MASAEKTSKLIADAENKALQQYLTGLKTKFAGTMGIVDSMRKEAFDQAFGGVIELLYKLDQQAERVSEENEMLKKENAALKQILEGNHKPVEAVVEPPAVGQ